MGSSRALPVWPLLQNRTIAAPKYIGPPKSPFTSREFGQSSITNQRLPCHPSLPSDILESRSRQLGLDSLQPEKDYASLQIHQETINKTWRAWEIRQRGKGEAMATTLCSSFTFCLFLLRRASLVCCSYVERKALFTGRLSCGRLVPDFIGEFKFCQLIPLMSSCM